MTYRTALESTTETISHDTWFVVRPLQPRSAAHAIPVHRYRTMSSATRLLRQMQSIDGLPPLGIAVYHAQSVHLVERESADPVTPPADVSWALAPTDALEPTPTYDHPQTALLALQRGSLAPYRVFMLTLQGTTRTMFIDSRGIRPLPLYYHDLLWS